VVSRPHAAHVYERTEGAATRPVLRRCALIAKRRPLGPRLAQLAAEVGTVDIAALARPLVGVAERHGMPTEIAVAITPQLENAAAAAKRRRGLLRLGSARCRLMKFVSRRGTARAAMELMRSGTSCPRLSLFYA